MLWLFIIITNNDLFIIVFKLLSSFSLVPFPFLYLSLSFIHLLIVDNAEDDEDDEDGEGEEEEAEDEEDARGPSVTFGWFGDLRSLQLIGKVCLLKQNHYLRECV